MTSKPLTPAQAKKLDTVVERLAKTLKIKASDEKANANLRRYADKWVRFKLGVRGTGPHGHGFDTDQRKVITVALADAFGIKAQPKKAAPAPSANKRGGKGTTAPRGKRGSGKRTTSQLAGEQQARAQAS